MIHSGVLFVKYLGAKWLPGKKVNFTPCLIVMYTYVMVNLLEETMTILFIKQYLTFYGTRIIWLLYMDLKIMTQTDKIKTQT